MWEEQTPLLPDVPSILSLGWHQTLYHLLPNKALIICQLPAMGSSLPWAQAAKLQSTKGGTRNLLRGDGVNCSEEEVGWTMVFIV